MRISKALRKGKGCRDRDGNTLVTTHAIYRDANDGSHVIMVRSAFE
jgi:uncharacterized protein (DUF342 family)